MTVGQAGSERRAVKPFGVLLLSSSPERWAVVRFTPREPFRYRTVSRHSSRDAADLDYQVRAALEYQSAHLEEEMPTSQFPAASDRLAGCIQTLKDIVLEEQARAPFLASQLTAVMTNIGLALALIDPPTPLADVIPFTRRQEPGRRGNGIAIDRDPDGAA